ncbi:MAG: gamma-glutamylcyclotransferase family protein [Sedimenticola sp.]
MDAGPGQLLYFAYGSNLCVPRLKARTPSCRVLGRGVIQGHRLSFHKIGRDGSAKCNALYTGQAPDLVEGAVYAISQSERAALDEAEDLGRGYDACQVQVETGAGLISALTYCARPEMIDDSLLPFDWYKAFVIAGARHHRLPGDYIAWLEAVPASEDLDTARSQENSLILSLL